MSLQIETDTWGQSWSLKTTSHTVQSLPFGLQSWAVVHMYRALSPLILPPYLIIIFMNLSREITAIKSNISSRKGKDTCMCGNILTKYKANCNWNPDEATSTHQTWTFKLCRQVEFDLIVIEICLLRLMWYCWGVPICLSAARVGLMGARDIHALCKTWWSFQRQFSLFLFHIKVMILYLSICLYKIYLYMDIIYCIFLVHLSQSVYDHMFYFLSCDPLKSILGHSLTLGLQFSDGSWRVPWLTLTERCPLPLCSAPLSASPGLLLANSGHLIKGLVGVMVVSVSPHVEAWGG